MKHPPRRRSDRIRLALAACMSAAMSACSNGDAPVFNPLPPPQVATSGAAVTTSTVKPSTRQPAVGPTGVRSPSAIATPPPPEPQPPRFDTRGGSDFDINGELALRVTSDFDCHAAKDDYFVRGYFDLGAGYRLAISVNVEHYTGPGSYSNGVQILIRRLRDTTYYASWYTDAGAATVKPANGGVDIQPAQLPAEAGTASTKPLTVSGRLGCAG